MASASTNRRSQCSAEYHTACNWMRAAYGGGADKLMRAARRGVTAEEANAPDGEIANAFAKDNKWLYPRVIQAVELLAGKLWAREFNVAMEAATEQREVQDVPGNFCLLVRLKRNPGLSTADEPDLDTQRHKLAMEIRAAEEAKHETAQAQKRLAVEREAVNRSFRTVEDLQRDLQTKLDEVAKLKKEARDEADRQLTTLLNRLQEVAVQEAAADEARRKAEETTAQNATASQSLQQARARIADLQARLEAMVEGERDPAFFALAEAYEQAVQQCLQLEIRQRKLDVFRENIRNGRGNESAALALLKIDTEFTGERPDVEAWIEENCPILVKGAVLAAQRKRAGEHQAKVDAGKHASLTTAADMAKREGTVRHIMRGALGLKGNAVSFHAGSSFVESGNPKKLQQSGKSGKSGKSRRPGPY